MPTHGAPTCGHPGNSESGPSVHAGSWPSRGHELTSKFALGYNPYKLPSEASGSSCSRWHEKTRQVIFLAERIADATHSVVLY